VAPGAAAGVRSTVGRLLGRPFPTKLGAGGRLQPYNPANGRYLSPANNPGVSGTPWAQFTIGVAQGAGSGASGVEAPVAVTKAQQFGQAVGRVLAALSNFF
jgi:hypothetical protein